MNIGDHQRKIRDEAEKAFARGPDRGRLLAILSATDRTHDDLRSQLLMTRERVRFLEMSLDKATKNLAEARRVIADAVPATYWKVCRDI